MPTKQSKPKVDSISCLTGSQAAAVLQGLLQRRPELRSEAEVLAKEVLGQVSFLDVADDVEAELLQVDYDDLNGRAGRRSFGYVEPSEAAWELLEEALEPFADQMKRYLKLGLEEQATECCQGILVGLYRFRESGTDILGWAEDFPAEAADNTLRTWRTGGSSNRTKGRRLPDDFIAAHIPKWEWAAKPRA